MFTEIGIDLMEEVMDEEKIKQFDKQTKTWIECIYYKPIWYAMHRCAITNGVCMVLCGEYCPYLK